MDLLKYVIRKCIRKDGYTNWMALYIDGEKKLETYSFDIEKVSTIHINKDNYLLDIIVEDDYMLVWEDLNYLFPDKEDFSYLLDNSDINVGSVVFLKSGVKNVIKVWEDYREEGEYNVEHWEYFGDDLINSIYKIHWVGHTINKFKVEGDDNEYIWEDYNYQQSYIYHYLKTKNKL